MITFGHETELDSLMMKSSDHTTAASFMDKIRKMRTSGADVGCTDTEFLRIAEFIDSKLKYHII